MTRRSQKLVMSALFAIVAFIIVTIQESKLAPSSSPQTNTTQTTSSTVGLHTVTRVVDGDTVVIDTGEKIRYIGVNTPESVDPRRAVQCFGKEASKFNAELVVGKKVALVGDVGNTDKYKRLLRYVYLEDGTFVNLKMVQDGYASVMTIPPNVAHASEFKAAESEAREAKRGLWGACK